MITVKVVRASDNKTIQLFMGLSEKQADIIFKAMKKQVDDNKFTVKKQAIPQTS